MGQQAGAGAPHYPYAAVRAAPDAGGWQVVICHHRKAPRVFDTGRGKTLKTEAEAGRLAARWNSLSIVRNNGQYGDSQARKARGDATAWGWL